MGTRSCAGVSRSPAVAIPVLHQLEGYPLVEAFRTVLSRVPTAFPDPAIWNSICRHYREMVGVNDIWPNREERDEKAESEGI